MAEVFGTIAAVIGVADVGAHISAKLYTFGVLVASADETISSISKEVALTSTVLKELGNILAKERPESPIITKIAIGNIEETVQECDKAFEQIDSLLLKRVPRLRLGKGNQGPKAAILLERFGWQALEPKVQLLRSNIDRLKSSLLLMLNVLMLAWLISERSGPQSVIRGKKILCEHLLDSKEAYDSKFKELENSRNYSFGTSRSTPINLTSNVLPTLFGNRSAHSPVTPDPYRRPSRTQLMSEPQQNAGLGVLSDQATLASYKINVLRKLQQDYNELFTSLVDEVRAQKYDIDRESHSRIECQIGIARSNELGQLDLIASTTSALQYSSDRQHGKAQEPSNSVSQTIVRDHDILQATCVAPAQNIKSDRDDADENSDASELIQRSQILETQSVTSQDDSMVMTSSTWCLCPHKYCKRSQGRGFSQPNHLAQHMRQVHSEVPVSDERDNQRIEGFLPNLPDYAKSDNTPSVSALARPVACKVGERQSTLWMKISDPPTDSASQRARLGRYNTKNHTRPTLGGSGGGRGAYDTTGFPKPKPPPKLDGSKQQKRDVHDIIRHDASFDHNPYRSGDVRYYSGGGSDARFSSRSTPLADVTGRIETVAATTILNICTSGERTVEQSCRKEQSCHNKGGPLGRKPTVPDLLVLWTTVRDISEI